MPDVPLFAVLALCLLAFYGPILQSSGTVLTGITPDPVAHMLTLLGDNRAAGRFFHYFDLSTNSRLWCDDVTYNPLHLIRWVSIALGSNLVGWGALIVGLHSLVFLTIYSYSRRVLRVSAAAALTGAAVSFFAASWPMWTAAIHPTAAVLLLVASVGEYALFLETGRRRHLLLCVLANGLQPYVSQSHSLIPSQVYLLGAVGLMAFSRRREAWSSMLPLLKIVWPLTLLGWMPILGPLLYAVGSGLSVREIFAPLRWAIDLSRSTQLLGLLLPVPGAAFILWTKLGIGKLTLPAPWFFGSFLLAPCLLALRQSARKVFRVLGAGFALCCAFFLAVDSISIPSTLFRPLQFWLPLAFPMLSGFAVSGGMEALALENANPRGLRTLHRLYGLMLGAAVLGGIALWIVGERPLTGVVFRLGLGGSGTEIPRLFRGTLFFFAGIAAGLLGYFLSRTAKGVPRLIALFAAIAAPALGIGYEAGLYARHSELDAMLSHPREIRFLQERVPGYAYRVGVLCASEMLLAEGDWKGYWTKSSERPDQVLHTLRLNGPWTRPGLAFALPYLHLYGPVHRELRREGNPFLQRPDSRQAELLTRRNVIVRPESDFFDDYGVRYWLSNFDLQRLQPRKFFRVAEGEYGAVFENPTAKPVAYFLDEPGAPLPLHPARDGVAVALPRQKGGRLSLHLDLRRMDARAMDAGGRASSLALQPSGLRWVVDVPPGASTVLFSPREAVWLRRLAIGSGASFLLLLALVFAGTGS